MHYPLMPSVEITNQCVMKLITELKLGKSSRPDQIAEQILYLDLEQVSHIVLLCRSIFNLSVQTAALLGERRTASINPVFE
jgi:hypothetical protein